MGSIALLVLVTAFGERPAIGDRIAPCEFADVRFQRRGLEELGPRRGFVLYFTRVECPLAPRFLPALAELEREHRDSGVQFLGVNVGAGDRVVEAAGQALEHGVTFPFVKDLELSTARACGATRAGEVVLLDGELRLRYRGRVDGRHRVGGSAGEAGGFELRDALADLLAGREVRLPETRAEGCLISPPPAPAPDVTWRDVAPIVARHCVPCHRADGDAPFGLREYEAAADHAAMIAEVVELGRMPPWHASDAHGRFANRRRLAPEERRLLLDWARTGARPAPRSGSPAAEAAGAPGSTTNGSPTAANDSAGGLEDSARSTLAPLAHDGRPWRIGAPDLVLATPTEMQLPADGIVPYQYTVLPFAFAEDTWVEAVEIRPRNRRAMHHCNLAHVRLGEEFRTENFVTGQVPGGDPLELDPGTAVLLPQGSILGLQIHYVTTGREETDRIEVALRFPRVRVQKRVRHLEIADLRFAIPPGAPAHPVRAARTFERDAIGIGLYAHMHKRGRDMAFTAIVPESSGGVATRETLLLIPTYDFDWQQSYRWHRGERRFAKGTTVECLAHFDNSPFNVWNPDPSATVRFGLQTEQEMMYGFLFYVDADEQLDLAVDPRTGRALAR